MKENAIETSKFVKTNRVLFGVTQAAFAEMIGKKRDDVASYETGRAIPPGNIILRIQNLKTPCPLDAKKAQ